MPTLVKRLYVHFSDGEVASVTLTEPQASEALQTIADGNNVTVHSGPNTPDNPPDESLTLRCFIKGSAVTHAILVPLQVSDTATVEDWGTILAPQGFVPSGDA